MNLATVLLAPWRATQKSSAWFALLLFGVCAIATVALGVFVPLHNERQWIAASSLYGFGTFYLWAFYMPNLLLLAIDARRLRIPGIEQTAATSAALYAALTIAIPVLVLCAFGQNPVFVAIVIAVAVSGGLLFALLPRYLSMWTGFLPVAFLSLKHHINIVLPAARDPIWLVWGTCFVLALLAVCAVRWHQLLSAEQQQTGFRSAMFMQFRSGMRGMWGYGSKQASEQLIRQVPDWLQPQPNFSKVGSAWPVNTLRVALGRLYMPATVGSYLRQMIPMALIGVVVVGSFTLISAENIRGFWSDTRQLWPLMLVWIAISMCAGLVNATAQCLYRRWSGNGHDLALLALLPTLGSGANARQSLLRAILTLPTAWQSCALLFMLLMTAAYLHVPAVGILCLAIAGLGCIAITAALALMIVGNRMPNTFGLTVFIMVAIVLFSVSLFISIMSVRWRLSTAIDFWLIAGWLLFDAVLLWLGLRGWRGLVRRPHPFLPNES